MKITRLLQSLCLSVGVATVLAACGGGSDSSNSGSTNHQPTADAGANQTVLVNAEVSLDGSNSKDPDGDALTYAWRIISKPATSNSSLSNSTTIKPKILVDKVGDYVLGLIVKDGSLTSVTDTMIIKVTANIPLLPLENKGVIFPECPLNIAPVKSINPTIKIIIVAIP